MKLKSINPYTNQTINETEEYSDEKVDKLLTESDSAFREWKATSFEQRSSLMEKAAELLRHDINRYAGSITSEMGKPIKESRAEVEKCAWVCEYYAKNASALIAVI